MKTASDKTEAVRPQPESALEPLASTRKQPRPNYPPEMQQLFELSSQGADADSWLTGAESSTVFLKDNARAEKVVLYASLPHVLIHGVLAPLKQLKTPDQSELGHGFVAPDTGWHIEHVSGGGRPDRVYLAPPLSPDSTNLKGGEKLIFRRHWPGAEHPTTEISQKLVHVLALHYVEERDAYCRIDEHGDLEDVIRIFDRPSEQPGESVLVITIKHQDFYEYAVLARMGVVFFFDFTRYRPGFFSDWSNQQRFESHNTHLFYEGGVKPGTGSYVNGRQIVLPPVTKRDIVRRYKQLRNPKKGNIQSSRRSTSRHRNILKPAATLRNCRTIFNLSRAFPYRCLQYSSVPRSFKNISPTPRNTS